MTKKRVSYILKRFPYIVKAVRDGKESVEINKSGRKECIFLDGETKILMELFLLVYEHEEDATIKKIMELRVIKGMSDLSIVTQQPIERSSYYRYKNSIIDKVYHCCIYKNIISLEEILSEKIN